MSIDKTAHFVVSAAIVMVAALWFSLSPAHAALLAVACGAAKEAWDSKRPGNRWSWGDMGANALGVLAALVVLSGR